MNNKPPAPPIFFRYVAVFLVCIGRHILSHWYWDIVFCVKYRLRLKQRVEH
jgi:hypothetical protein